MNRMVSMSPRERLEHMAEMYDAYGYGGVMVGGRRRSKSKSMKAGAVKPVYWKKSKSAACKSKSKTSKSGRLLNDYQRFVQQERCNGLTMVEIGRLWRKIKKTYGGVSKKKSGSKKGKRVDMVNVSRNGVGEDWNEKNFKLNIINLIRNARN